MQKRREAACGKILCAFLGGAAPFCLEREGKQGCSMLKRRGTWRERCPLVFSAAPPARQMGGGVMSPVSAAPPTESLLCSPVEWRWGRRAHRSISKVSDLYGSCSPVCRSECPCPMFNSWQTHAFSVTVAFMASHTILLVQPQPYKDIKKFLWCSYLGQSSRVTTSAMHTPTWRCRLRRDNIDRKSKPSQQLNCSQGRNFHSLFYYCLHSSITELLLYTMRELPKMREGSEAVSRVVWYLKPLH